MKITFDADGIMLESETDAELRGILDARHALSPGSPAIWFADGTFNRRLHLCLSFPSTREVLMELFDKIVKEQKEQNAFTSRVETALKDLGFKLPKRRCK